MNIKKNVLCLLLLFRVASVSITLSGQSWQENKCSYKQEMRNKWFVISLFIQDSFHKKYDQISQVLNIEMFLELWNACI